ncbi:cell division protein DivIVA [Micrococcus porci]|uniref:cell division protein DivIVA n=1 Tax=Micrococcus TaxID=1269 RepID=UPI001CCE9E5B|nr:MULTISPECIES: cell division protein DivIVA [Micrococcus]MCG7421809.1 cell division protein DivIVA [Micrococcus sp. ACRRV]UBH25788.1 cell division protein DivIVA [Micrococcus porci]
MTQPIWIAVLVVAVVAVAALAAAALGRALPRPADPAGQAPPHPVLLPEHPRAADVDRLRLATAVPGYQRDQVDEVLARLRAALAADEERIAALEARLGEGDGVGR